MLCNAIFLLQAENECTFDSPGLTHNWGVMRPHCTPLWEYLSGISSQNEILNERKNTHDFLAPESAFLYILYFDMKKT